MLALTFTLIGLLMIFVRSEHHICNHTHSCANSVIDCTTSNKACNVECNNRLSCANATVLCGTNQNCITKCTARSACLSIQIICANNTISDTLSCAAHGSAPNALTNMHFVCNSRSINQECNIECDSHSVCAKATIDGRNSFGSLNIKCVSDEACTDLTLFCPPANQPEGNKLCTITGWDDVGSSLDTVHKHLNIYAVNSWNDINLSRYLAWVYANSSMFCGADYADKCLIANAAKLLEWNCINDSSPCFYANESVSSIHCDTDYECLSKTLQCDDSKACSVRCSGYKSCSQSIINCPANHKCDVVCSGYESCDNGTKINCPSNADCNIMCGVPQIGYLAYGTLSCKEAMIDCPQNEYECNVSVFGERGFEDGAIECNDAAKCHIVCSGVEGCKQSTFNGINTDLLSIECINEVEFKSCDDMKVLCPPYDEQDGKKCVISGKGDTHRELHLFCINSWDDLDIELYTEAVILAPSKSRMYCDRNYNHSCVLAAGLLEADACFCDFSASFIPNTTKEEEIEESATDWVLIISVVIACFFCILCVCVCVLFSKKDGDRIAYENYRNTQKEYNKVANQDDEKETQITNNQHIIEAGAAQMK